jgi:hypothetical protein
MTERLVLTEEFEFESADISHEVPLSALVAETNGWGASYLFFSASGIFSDQFSSI